MHLASPLGSLMDPSVRRLETFAPLGSVGGTMKGGAAGAAAGGAATGSPYGAGAGFVIGAAAANQAGGVPDPARGYSGIELLRDPSKRGSASLDSLWGQVFYEYDRSEDPLTRGRLWTDDRLVTGKHGWVYPVDQYGITYEGAGWASTPAGVTNGFGPFEWWTLDGWEGIGAPKLSEWRWAAVQVGKAPPGWGEPISDAPVAESEFPVWVPQNDASGRFVGTVSQVGTAFRRQAEVLGPMRGARGKAAAAADANAARKGAIVVGVAVIVVVGYYLMRQKRR